MDELALLPPVSLLPYSLPTTPLWLILFDIWFEEEEEEEERRFPYILVGFGWFLWPTGSGTLPVQWRDCSLAVQASCLWLTSVSSFYMTTTCLPCCTLPPLPSLPNHMCVYVSCLCACICLLLCANVSAPTLPCTCPACMPAMPLP